MNTHLNIHGIKALVFLFVVSMSFSCSVSKRMSDADSETAIKAVMSMQEKAWSDGDVHQFMEGYWKSENLSFVGRTGINKGWQTTLDNYIKGYPTKDAMGVLTFDILEMNRISDNAYHMIGRYTLVRKEDKPTGLFTLIWKYIDGKWLIVSDHTSG
ncbi:MAG: DUF4440 domain-containing protein [Saprospiraceae bacterium]|nr:DUF4440 domain-containing protein [Saprospiraceae bacterium]